MGKTWEVFAGGIQHAKALLAQMSRNNVCKDLKVHIKNLQLE